ncbi:uncharacterized protein LOC134770100 [Penaeus indicus]|uniref:uncharacterized protein LOC134770100 n=1 Tax=Penaeus indicus TaxID=29960 RepID=UPI00300C685B
MAGALNTLLSRGYHSDPQKEHWDFQHPVRRQLQYNFESIILQLPDESVEGARLVESIEVKHVDEVPKTSRDSHAKHSSKTARLVGEDIRAATPPGAYPAVRSQLLPPSTPSPRRPIGSPQVACEVVTVQADVHHIPAHIDRISSEDLEIFPIPATGEFEVQDIQPQLISGGQLPEEAFQPEAQQQPSDVPLPYKAPGPVVGEESFIPGTVTPIRHPSAPPRSVETPNLSQLSRLDTEKEVLNIIDKHTSGILITFTDLLPEIPTRKSVVSVFSTLLGEGTEALFLQFIVK